MQMTTSGQTKVSYRRQTPHSSTRSGLVLYLVTGKAFLSHPHADDTILMEHLRARGCDVHLVAWNDSTVDWRAANLVIIRSTWDYCQNHASFITWANRVATITNLWNPIEVIQWNADKHYLMDLQATGLPIVPTVLLDEYCLEHLSDLCNEWSTEQIVIKPTIGSNAYATFLVKSPLSAYDKSTIYEASTRNTLFAQPHLRSVESYGERSLGYINGEFVHAFRKTPFYAFRSDSTDKDKEIAVYPSGSELRLAELIMQRLKHRLLFGRVDMLNDDNGTPRIMELEFIEPRLNLHYSDRSLTILADAVVCRNTFRHSDNNFSRHISI
jgi:hypothetical protein